MGSKSPKGLILAAGFGTRLKPLTLTTPKPLTSIFGVTLLDLALSQLVKAGVKEIAVNTHHLAEQVEKGCKNSGVDVYISHEPKILGTGGVYPPLRDWLGDSDLVVLNGDVLSDVDINEMVSRHQRSKAGATMMVLPAVISGETAVNCKNHKVVSVSKETPTGCEARNFACTQILSPAFLDRLPESGFFDIFSKGYIPALAEGQEIGAIVHHGLWHDIRNPKCYFEALKDVMERGLETGGILETLSAKGVKFDFNAEAKVFRNLGATFDPTAELGPNVVIDRGAIIGKNVRIENSLLLSGAKADEDISSKIITSGEEISLS